MELDLLNLESSALSQKVNSIMELNKTSAGFGLELTEKQALELVQHHAKTLRVSGRVEFGEGIMKKLIFAFCDSSFIVPSRYENTLEELMDSFYYLKNESKDGLSDDELLEIMEKLYNGKCQGSADYMREVIYIWLRSRSTLEIPDAEDIFYAEYESRGMDFIEE